MPAGKHSTSLCRLRPSVLHKGLKVWFSEPPRRSPGPRTESCCRFGPGLFFSLVLKRPRLVRPAIEPLEGVESFSQFTPLAILGVGTAMALSVVLITRVHRRRQDDQLPLHLGQPLLADRFAKKAAQVMQRAPATAMTEAIRILALRAPV